MYLPTLSTMSSYRIDDFLINKLDIWLGTRRKAVRKFLSPLQFSLDCDIDEDTAIHLFTICTESKLGVLDKRYTVVCNHCDRLLGEFEQASDVPANVFCPECIDEIDIRLSMIRIWFSLVKTPAEHPYSEEVRLFSERSYTRGNELSLRAETLEASQNPMARGLINSLNERIRSRR